MKKLIMWFDGLDISNPYIVFALLLLRKFAIGAFVILTCMTFVYALISLSDTNVGQVILLSIVAIIVGVATDGA